MLLHLKNVVVGVLIGWDAVRRASEAVLLRAFGAVLAAQSLPSEELIRRGEAPRCPDARDAARVCGCALAGVAS